MPGCAIPKAVVENKEKLVGERDYLTSYMAAQTALPVRSSTSFLFVTVVAHFENTITDHVDKNTSNSEIIIEKK